MKNILEKIVLSKRKELVDAKELISFAELENKIEHGALRSLSEALSNRQKVNIIAELKKASPSKGFFDKNLNIRDLSEKYTRYGAGAISVLTEQNYFYGQLEYLAVARSNSNLPILRKDFIFDPYQIVETKANKADALLLICSILKDKELSSLIQLAGTFELECLVEVHNKDDLKKALDCGAMLIGINSRNLKDFNVKFEVISELASLIPAGKIVVAESGIKNANDIEYFKKAGVNNFLIGETLIMSSNLQKTFEELLNA